LSSPRTRARSPTRTTLAVTSAAARVGGRARVEHRAIVEQGVVVTVVAFDWNCQQHITPRFSEPELEDILAPIRQRLQDTAAEGA
jgi:hypothetical protein